MTSESPVSNASGPVILRTPVEPDCHLYAPGHCVHSTQASKSQQGPEKIVYIAAVSGNDIWFSAPDSPDSPQHARTHSANALARLLKEYPKGVEGALRSHGVLRVGDTLISLCTDDASWDDCSTGPSFT